MPTPRTAENNPSPSQETQKFRTQMGHISRHSTVFFAGTLFTTAAGYLFKVYLARKLGAESLGIYALGMTIVGLVGLFAGLGLPQAAVRFVSLYRATGKLAELRSFIVRSCGFWLLPTCLWGRWSCSRARGWLDTFTTLRRSTLILNS